MIPCRKGRSVVEACSATSVPCKRRQHAAQMARFTMRAIVLWHLIPPIRAINMCQLV